MRTVPLKEVAEIVMGSAPPGKSYNHAGNGLPMIAGAGDYGEKFPNPKKWTTAPTRVTEIGDLIVCVRATIGDLNWADKKYCLGRGVAGIRALKEKLDINFAAHYINAYKRELSKLGTGSTFLAIRRADLEDFPIPLPPLSEQKRIAAILDKADAIRRKRQAAIKLADDFLRATFLDMFGDPVTNPKGWVVKPIGELLADKPSAARTGPFGSQLKYSEFTEEGVPVLGIDNVVTNYFRWTTPRCLPPEKYENFKRYRVFPDDIIITIMGTTGRVAVAPSDLPKCMSTKHLCVLTLNKKVTDPVFLWATLLFDNKVRGQAKRSSGGAIMEGWNMGAIKAIHVRVPPLNNQLKFRKIIERTQKLKKQMLTWEADGSSQLFNSLSQRAFRGEL